MPLHGPTTDLITTSQLTAKEIADRASGRSMVPIRYGFVSHAPKKTPDQHTPLVQILRTKRGAKVRLALYLSYIWLAVKEPHDITRVPAHVWARLLGLPDPDNNGARQVRAANRWLKEHKLIQIVPEPGDASTIILLDETGSGRTYVLPGLAYTTVRKASKDGHRYFKLPIELWTQGWVAALSSSAIAMLLVLFESARGNETAELWHAGSVTRNTYGISESLRSTGLRELASAGLVTTQLMTFSGHDNMKIRRTRKTYRINHGFIEGNEPEPRPPEGANV